MVHGVLTLFDARVYKALDVGDRRGCLDCTLRSFGNIHGVMVGCLFASGACSKMFNFPTAVDSYL